MSGINHERLKKYCGTFLLLVTLLYEKKKNRIKFSMLQMMKNDYGSIQVGIESATKKAPCVRQLFGAVVLCLRVLCSSPSVCVYKVSVCKRRGQVQRQYEQEYIESIWWWWWKRIRNIQQQQQNLPTVNSIRVSNIQELN